MRLLLLFALCLGASAWYYGRDSPDDFSVGGVFPLPADLTYSTENYTIHPQGMKVDAQQHSGCDIIMNMTDRYLNKWMFPFPVTVKNPVTTYTVFFFISEACPADVPQADMNETYAIRMTNTHATVQAQSVWGALRAMETFSQLIYFDEAVSAYKVRSASINDSPRFPWRGLMLDSSRHFLTTKIIKRQLDLMSQNKLNLFHWHMVDSEAFSYVSKKFPALSGVGAYTQRHVYSPADVQDIVQYARLRGIRVLPEFDTPGHTGAWRGIDGLLTKCYDTKGRDTNLPNLIDASNENSYDFLMQLFQEAASVFPEKTIHLGGDEVDGYIQSCWVRNPKIQKYLADHGMTAKQLQAYYFKRLQEAYKKATSNKKIFWQEVYDDGMSPEKDAIIHIWKGATHTDIQAQAKRLTGLGFKVIVSACWYMNYIKYGADWAFLDKSQAASHSQYYYCDPANFTGSQQQKDMVLGGTIAIWGEYVDSTNVESRLWPRSSAAAERLWSPAAKTTDHEQAWPRMHELTCRQISRGYRVQPVYNPDYCPYEWAGE